MEKPYSGSILPTPGLKKYSRAEGGFTLRWIADEACVKAGYPVKTANLDALADDPVGLSLRCQRLQAEMLAWKHNRSISGIGAPEFDGTWGSLFGIYENDPESPFNVKLKPRSLETYSHTLRRLRGHIGAVRIDETDGRKLRRWFSLWADQEDPENPRSPYRHLAAGHLALAVVKAALSFGVFCRYPGCAEFKLVVAEASFPAVLARCHAPTREQMLAAGEAAIRAGAPSRALVYALQFETTVRQSDIIGEWVALSDPRPSAVIANGEKWIGPTWAHVDENLIWRMTHGKTDQTSGARGVYDLTLCLMVMEHVLPMPVTARAGPLIVNERTGLPYTYNQFRHGWHCDYKAAGLPKGLWNRDTRAGGNTEAQRKGALLEDRRKVIGHAKDSPTTAQVYDRDHLEAHRRVAAARNRKDGE